MKRNVLSFLIVCCLLAACKNDKDNDIVIGTSADYKPFMYYENSVLTGFEKDVFDEIAKCMKRNPVYKDMSFDGLIGGLQTKRLDIAVACMTKTEEREKSVDFSKPYYGDQVVILVHKDSSIQKVDDLQGKNVGVQMGTTFALRTSEWQKQGKVAKIVSLSKIPELIQEWKNKRVDALMMGNSEAKSIVETNADMKIVPLEELGKSFVSFALPKGSKDTQEVNAALIELEKNGTMAALIAKWKL